MDTRWCHLMLHYCSQMLEETTEIILKRRYIDKEIITDISKQEIKEL